MSSASSNQSFVREGAGYDERFPSDPRDPDASSEERNPSSTSSSLDGLETESSESSSSSLDGVDPPVQSVIGPDGRPENADYLHLYQAALEGNWDKAKTVVEQYREAIRDSITKTRESVLHIAFASKHTAFVKEVVGFLTDKDLERTNENGDTALCVAAKLGTVTIAKEMVKKNNRLPLIRSSEERTPLHIAAKLGSRDMTSYLYSVTPFEGLPPDERMEILMATITNDMYDMALEILEKDRTLATSKDAKTIAALSELAKKPFVIGSKSRLSLWQRCFNFWFKCFSDKAVIQALVHELVVRVSNEVQQFDDRRFPNIFLRAPLFDAAEFGNAEFIIILIRSHPNIILTTNNFHQSLFHIAVKNRQESVFNLLNEIGPIKEVTLSSVDIHKQNILHLAGQLAPSSRLNVVPGAALQMQRELLWFKEVEKIVPPSYLKMRNSDNLTPWEVFTDKHKELRGEGQKWMKDTVNFYIVVATLITAVVFAAAFTVPGGTNPDTGTPIMLKSIWIFFISDTIALLSSSYSILMFLLILASRFTEMDFHKELPTQWALGLITLLISIAGMVAAFSASCFLVFKSEMSWLPIAIIALAASQCCFPGLLMNLFTTPTTCAMSGLVHTITYIKLPIAEA
ncbi:hypothetical protein ACB092_07G057900 [Castanea dentata]